MTELPDLAELLVPVGEPPVGVVGLDEVGLERGGRLRQLLVVLLQRRDLQGGPKTRVTLPKETESTEKKSC